MSAIQCCESLTDIPDPTRPLVLAIGAFDGLHLGHQQVIRTAHHMAQAGNADLGVLRFHPHPARILRPEDAPPLLFTEQQTQDALGELGVNLHLRLPFTAELACMEPAAFLQELRTRLPGLIRVVVGPNWRFGRKGRGDVGMLRTFASQNGFEVHVAPGTAWGEALISSTRIRENLLEGHLDAARAMLGRPYTLTGTVREGKRMGRELGFPTANFIAEQEVLPPPGVYAMRVHLGGQSWNGAGYITHVPPLVEVHLLDFSGDLYARHLQVDLVSFRRPATPIPDLVELKRVIDGDVQAIRKELTGTA